MPTFRAAETFQTGGIPDSSGFSMTGPARQAGDIIIAVQVNDPHSNLSDLSISGGAAWFTLTQFSGERVKVYWRYVGSTGEGFYSFTHAIGSYSSVIMVTVKDVSPGLTPSYAFQIGYNSTTGTTPSLTPSSADCLELRFATGNDYTTWTAPAGYTERADTTVPPGTWSANCTLATKQITSTTPTGTQNFTASNLQTVWGGLTIQIANPVFTGWGMPV